MRGRILDQRIVILKDIVRHPQLVSELGDCRASSPLAGVKNCLKQEDWKDVFGVQS
jgi:hypothetical protein